MTSPRLLRELGETLRLAAPLVIGQLTTIMMNVVDTLLAGHLNAHTLAAVAVGTAVWSLVFLASIGVLLAVPPSVSQLHGAGRHTDIGPLFRQALWLALLLGLLLTLGVRRVEPLLQAIGVEPAVVPDAMRFLRGVSWGAPALTGFFVLRGLSEGIARTRPTMYFGALGLLALVPSAYTLMYGNARLGIPTLGAGGLGIATALVLWLQMLGLLSYVVLRKHYQGLALFARFDWPKLRPIFEFLRLGVPMGVAIFMEGSLFVAVALLIGSLGTAAVASHQIALNVSSVTFMVPLGLAMATTVRVGQAVGRDDASGVRYAGYAGLLLALATQLVSATAMALLPWQIASLYTEDAAIIQSAAALLMLAAIFQFSDGIQVVANGALRGLKDTRVPMLITTFAYWGVGMPLGYYLGLGDLSLGPRGMWMGLIAGLTVAAGLLYWRFQRLALGERWLRLAPVPPSA